MFVKLIGPDEGHESTHKIDAATAAFLAHRITVPGSQPVINIDDERVVVTFAGITLFTEGDRLDSELTLALEKP